MNPISGTALFSWAFIGFSAGALLHVLYLALEKKIFGRLAAVCMGLGLISQTFAMISRGLAIGHAPLTNMYEFISLLAWFAAVLYFIFQRLYRQPVLGALICFGIIMLLASASLLPKNANQQLVPALQSYWLGIHVSLAALGEAAFLVAFAANILFLLKSGLKPDSPFARHLPDAEKADQIGYKAVTVGYPLFTVGALFAGAIWAEQAWGRFWSWDPKEVGSLIVWLVYSAYLHARLVKGWSGRRAAMLSAIGFLCTLFTFFANLVLGGLHAYN